MPDPVFFKAVLTFLANEIPTNTYINLMDQYHSCYRAMDNPPLDRDLKENEYQEVLELAARLGLKRLDQRHTRRLFVI